MTVKEIKTKLEGMVPVFAAKIAPVYQVLKWMWDREELSIPSVGEIENELYSLIKKLNDDIVESRGGGFTVYYHMPNEKNPGYHSPSGAGYYGLSFNCNEIVRFK